MIRVAWGFVVYLCVIAFALALVSASKERRDGD